MNLKKDKYFENPTDEALFIILKLFFKAIPNEGIELCPKASNQLIMLSATGSNCSKHSNCETDTLKMLHRYQTLMKTAQQLT